MLRTDSQRRLDVGDSNRNCAESLAISDWLCCIAALCWMLSAGCSREYYREQADEEAYSLIESASDDPRWAIPNMSIEMDRRSRYYDSSDPDFPPMPADDPVSHQLMHCLDCKNGWHWHETYGSAEELENPTWRDQLGEYMELTGEGAIKLGLEDTVRLAIIQTPSWQQQLETLYLSALTVSTERFRYDVQFFGGNDTTFQHLGQERGFGGESNSLTTNSDFQLRRRFSTAGQLLVGFANSFVWQFAGPDANTSATSLINFNLVQPLLRTAGQDVELERLTRAERGLLANLRAYERWRKGFYTGIAVGSSGPGTNGAQRTGGFQGGTGITGFTGQGAGGLGQVGGTFGRGGFFGAGGAVGGGAAGGAAGVAGGGAARLNGFIGLLQQLQELRNQRDSLSAQLRTQGQLEAQLEAGLIDIIQVDRFRQSILTARANLLAAENSFESAIQSFVTGTFSLPPDVPVELDESFIKPFQFVDRSVTEVLNSVSDFIDTFGELPDEPAIEQLRDALNRIAVIEQQAGALFEMVEGDLAHLETQSELREKHMSPQEQQEFRMTKQDLAKGLSDVRQRFSTVQEQFEQTRRGLNPGTRRSTADRIVELTSELSALVQETSLVQARARVEAIVLEPFRLSTDEAVEIARANRLDWMNNRAALVDAWRLIQFNADALQSDLTIIASGDMGTVDRNSVKFRDETGSLRLGVQFDAPLTRLIERNNFRAQLIEFQQDRRQFIQFEDGIRTSMDAVRRQLSQLELNLAIQRQAVVTSIRRYDSVLESLREPPPPAVPGQAPAQVGETVAENLLSALEDLSNAQNAFMSVWLAHYGARMGLMRDLGIMRLDENNMWIDESLEEALQRATPPGSAQYALPPDVPEVWYHELDELPDVDGDMVQAEDRQVQGDGIAPLRWLRGIGSRLASKQTRAPERSVQRSKPSRRVGDAEMPTVRQALMRRADGPRRSPAAGPSRRAGPSGKSQYGTAPGRAHQGIVPASRFSSQNSRPARQAVNSPTGRASRAPRFASGSRPEPLRLGDTQPDGRSDRFLADALPEATHRPAEGKAALGPEADFLRWAASRQASGDRDSRHATQAAEAAWDRTPRKAPRFPERRLWGPG